MQTNVLRIGTRGSALALAQASQARTLLMAAHGLREEAFEIVVISTSGDRIQDRPLSEAGGKGLFTKELEEAMFDGRIDIAVHSSKDMPTRLPDGLELSAFLEREDVRDAFIGRASPRLADLPANAVVGSSSLRRQALVRRMRPDIEVVTFRGNVQTRLRKLDEMLAGEAQGFTKQERLNLDREREKLDKALGGIKDMGSTPDLMLGIDTNKEAIAILEAKRLGIPVVAIVDSNCDPDKIDFPIPGNDDAARAISLYCDLIAKAAIDGIARQQGAMGVDIGASAEAPIEPTLEEAPAEAPAETPAEENKDA